ncbi:MAG: SPOR domain-containing protein [Methylococcales bacterium]
MEQRLKERLIGTAVITALALIFLPMLIDEDDQRWNQQQSSVEAPPLPEKFNKKPQILSDAGVETTRLFPTPDKQSVNPESSSATASDDTNSAQSKYGLETQSPAILKTEVIDKTTRTEKTALEMDKQLKSLLPAGDSKTTQSQTHEQSTPVAKPKTYPITPPPLARVVKRPYPTATEAQSRLAQSATNAEIATYKTAPKPQQAIKSLKSDLTGLWIVQAGVFKEKANAEALRKKLSQSGFSAYLEAVNTELGQLIRVRAARVPEERTARQMVKTLDKRFALKSIAFPETRWNSKRAKQ